jgi:uncharacterized caspase-like protein
MYAGEKMLCLRQGLGMLFLAFAFATAASAGEKRVALVIGNAAYRHVSRLPNPANDAHAMKAVLQGLGIKVEVLVDADRAAMLSALERLAQVTLEAELAIVHYSGHGIAIASKNYLLPISADLNEPDDVDAQAVPFEVLYAAVARTQGRKLILLDACRDNPFAVRLRRAQARGLAPPAAPTDILVAYATKDGNVAEDGPPGGNSPFTAALLKHLQGPGDVREMFRAIRDDVLTATAGRQSPFVYGQVSAKTYSLAPKR